MSLFNCPVSSSQAILMSTPSALLFFQQAEQPESQLNPIAVWMKLDAKNKLRALESLCILCYKTRLSAGGLEILSRYSPGCVWLTVSASIIWSNMVGL